MTGSKPPVSGPAGINPTADGKVALIPDADVEDQQSPEPAMTTDATDVVRVAIRSPFQVVHARRAYLPGEVAEVPPAVAQRWLRNRWVDVVDQPPADESAPAARRGRRAP
jgi:hypothetical protein